MGDPPPPRARLDSDLGRTSGQLLDILVSRQDWEGARTYLARLHGKSPGAAQASLVEVLMAQAGATPAEEARLEIYRLVLSVDPANPAARAEADRLARARAGRSRADEEPPVIDVTPPATTLPARPPMPSTPGLLTAPLPEIEVRDAGADAAIRKARDTEHKARAAVEAQVTALTAERERLLAEARASAAERERLSALLHEATGERDRLSADLEVARTSYVGPPPSGLGGRPSLVDLSVSRRTRRLRRAAAGFASAGAVAVAALIAVQPTRIEVSATSLSLFDRRETAQASATRTLRLGVRRPARGVWWSSADPRVATVDAAGVITPVGTGRTRIEALDGVLAASVEVTVSLPARVVLTPGELTLTPDRPEAAVAALVLDGSGAPWEKGAELAWASSDPGVATVAGGKVQRRAQGEAVITVSLGEIGARLPVHALDERTALVRACEAGGVEACVDLGQLVEKTDKSPAGLGQAFTLYERACERGALRACVARGEHFENGAEGTPDVGAALAAYRKACDGKHAPGCTRLGRLYEATVRDYGKALPAYRAACDAQDLEGCWRLGTMLELGTGVPRDTVAAAELHGRACEGGKAPACTSLAHMRWNGSGAVTRDVPRAIALFEKACEGKHGEACLFLALKHKAGDGVVEDPRKAAVYFGKACAAGHKGACVIASPPAAP